MKHAACSDKIRHYISYYQVRTKQPISRDYLAESLPLILEISIIAHSGSIMNYQ